jgi:nitroreductase
MLDGARILAHNIGRASWLVLACATRPNPELDSTVPGNIAAVYGSIFPAVWSFQLALRGRGLGTVITTLHLHAAGEVASLLHIPDGVTQACLMPIAYTAGLDFLPARRRPVAEIVYADRWGEAVGHQSRDR